MPLGTAPAVSPAALLAALGAVPELAWGQPQPDTEPTNPGYRTSPLMVAGRYTHNAPPFRSVLVGFAPVWAAWLAEVPAGGRINPHIDQGPYYERWHVPITPGSTFNGQPVQPGVPFPVRHWETHWVENLTGRPRVHLVIDRDIPVGVPSAPFQRIED
jgi:hypothetical protein